MCDAYGLELPGHRTDTLTGVKEELQRLAQVVSEPTPLPSSGSAMQTSLRVHAEKSHQRRQTLEGQRRPSYGKRIQLIPDGLNSTSRRVAEAMKLEHPFNSGASLKEDHRMVLNTMHTDPKMNNLRRLKTLGEWRATARSKPVLDLQQEHEKLACENARRLGRKPRTAMMAHLGNLLHIEDHAVPTLGLTGMPIVGDALQPPFFQQLEEPAKISIQEFFATARTRRVDAMRKVAFMGRKGGPEQSEAVYLKTLKEVAQGTMAGPFSVDELEAKHGRFFNLVPSFGLTQGLDSEGRPKHRRTDDNTAGHTNLAACRKQKITMAMADSLSL